MKKDKNTSYGRFSRETIRLAWISGAGVALGLAAFIAGMLVIERTPAVFVASIAFLCVWSGVMLALIGRRQREEKRMRAEAIKQLPHTVSHPLAKRIFAQYEYDRLEDLTQYISFRGWKLKNIEESDALISMTFTRKGHEAGVTIGDGETSVIIDGSSDDRAEAWIDMDGCSEPIELWNRIVAELRNAAKGRV